MKNIGCMSLRMCDCRSVQLAYSKACPDPALRNLIVWNLGPWHCGKMLSEKIWVQQGEYGDDSVGA